MSDALLRSMLAGMAAHQIAELESLIEQEKQRRSDGTLTGDEISLLESGNLIDCVKAIRNRTGLPLRDSRALMDKARGITVAGGSQ